MKRTHVFNSFFFEQLSKKDPTKYNFWLINALGAKNVILILVTNLLNHGLIRSIYFQKNISSFQSTNSKQSHSYISFHWYMAIVYNPNALLPTETKSSDSDSLKSVVGMECDSIDSFSSLNDESKNNEERNVLGRSNIILSSDEVVAEDISKTPPKVEVKNINLSDQEIDRTFRRAIEMESNYFEYEITD